MLRRVLASLRAQRTRREFEAGMSEELRFHLAQCVSDLIRSGVSPKEAARRARVEFGSLATTEGECREAYGLHLFDEIQRQFRYAIRLLRKTPGFTATALGTLALCLGANLTIFAVIDAVLLRPLPFPEADRLVTVFNTYIKAGVPRDGSSLTNYYERRGQIAAVESMALYRYGTATIGEPGSTEREPISRVTADFFSTLGTAPALGRAFTEAETTVPMDRVVLLTDAYWRQRLNADSHVVGRPIRVDGLTYSVIGVLPASFRFLSAEARLYVPLASRPERRLASERHSGGNLTHTIARLKPGASVSQAQAQIDLHNSSLEAVNPRGQMMADAGFRSVVVPLHADHVTSIRSTLLLLQGGAIALLLIGAVNLMNLLLIRANGRAKEISVRQALGASRGHLVSEVVVQSIFADGQALGFERVEKLLHAECSGGISEQVTL